MAPSPWASAFVYVHYNVRGSICCVKVAENDDSYTGTTEHLENGDGVMIYPTVADTRQWQSRQVYTRSKMLR